MGPLQPTFVSPVNVTLIVISMRSMLEQENCVPIRDLMGDGEGVLVVTSGATGDLEGVCGVGTCV